MTVYSDLSRVRYVANGQTTEFSVPFPYMTNNDGTAQLSVFLDDSDTPLLEGKDYYIVGIGNYNQEVEQDDGLIIFEERFDSGTVIFYTAPAKDSAIAIIRNVALIQGIQFINGEEFPAEDFSNALDKLTMAVQELKENQGRSVILPPTSNEKPIEVRDNIIQAANVAINTAEEAIKLISNAPEIIASETETAINNIEEFANQKVNNLEILIDNTQNEIATNSEKARIWAEGEQAEVQELGGELSSMGAADLAYAIANAPEDVPVDTSGLKILNVIKGEKGDKGDKGDDGKDGGGLEIGDVAFAVMGIDESKNLRRYLNGQVISQSQFESFTNKVKTAIQLNPSLATSETNWQAEVTNSSYGICGKFVIDDTLGTIRLPKYPDWSIREVGQASVVGNGTNLTFEQLEGKSNKYGLVVAPSTAVLYSYGAGNYNYPMGVTTDATKSGMIADLTNANTEDKLQGKWFIQVATGTEESVDVTREIELNNPFSLLDYKWSEYELNNASWLISNGAFHSGTVYKAVYELLLKIKNGTVTKDGVSVKLSTEEYSDTDFVINTADTTFRLPIKVKLASGNAVCGNGMTLGVTDGSRLMGLGTQAASGGPFNGREGMYGTNVGTNTTQGLTAIANNSIGITTDPTKSGIETSSSGLKLYFYVGETIQDANVIAASGVLSAVTDGVKKSSVTDRETVVRWGMPDYSTAVVVTAPYIATYPCWFIGYSVASAGTNQIVYVNGVAVAREAGDYACTQIPLDIGDVVTISAGSIDTMSICAMKGAN